MSETLRAFIAIELPETAVTFVIRIQETLKSYRFKVKWVQPENMHLTLKFLGEINREDRVKIEDAISDAGKDCGPIQLSVKGMGVFPGVKRPRVVWCGLKGDTASLVHLQGQLDEKLIDLGFSKEKRPFKGHLTLGRVKGSISPEKIIDAMKEISGFGSKPFKVEAITLFSSDLKPSGAVYTRLKSISL
ncbi:MAG: RNA 2',3'-cyclic phosphodiesterase [Deltaproteobacteria bacterium]|nr:RNA 2',3'-cyclic phosphodiesterase [Deltaproteobacteria bacterium]